MALSYGEFISDPKLNPWGTSNENATQAAWARYQAKQQGGAGTPGRGGAGVSPTPGTLPGAEPLPGYTPAAGGIPATSDPIASTQHLIAGLMQNLPGIAQAIGGLTGASTAALRNEYPQEYFDTLGTLFGNVGRRARGEYADLFPLLATTSAESGVGRGTTGSPLSSLHLQGLLGRTQYDLEEQALRDLGLLKAAVPTVEPFRAENIVPNINMIELAKQLANLYRSAPNPEDAYQRNLTNALQGLNRGLNLGGGGGDRIVQNWQPNFWPSLPEQSRAAAIPAASPAPPAPPAAPPGGGWGLGWNNMGGGAQVGNVPQDLAGNVPPGFPQGAGAGVFESPNELIGLNAFMAGMPDFMLSPFFMQDTGPMFQQARPAKPEFFMNDIGPIVPRAVENEEEWLRRLFEEEE